MSKRVWKQGTDLVTETGAVLRCPRLEASEEKEYTELPELYGILSALNGHPYYEVLENDRRVAKEPDGKGGFREVHVVPVYWYSVEGKYESDAARREREFRAEHYPTPKQPSS